MDYFEDILRAVAMAAEKTAPRFGLMSGRVRIAHLKLHSLNGFICTKIYYFLSGAYWVYLSGMIVVRNVHQLLVFFNLDGRVSESVTR